MTDIETAFEPDAGPKTPKPLKPIFSFNIMIQMEETLKHQILQ